jgi:hypothetical protein
MGVGVVQWGRFNLRSAAFGYDQFNGKTPCKFRIGRNPWELVFVKASCGA